MGSIAPGNPQEIDSSGEVGASLAFLFYKRSWEQRS